MMEHPIIENEQLRDRGRVFRDRRDAGERLANLLQRYARSDAVVCAIPAGGVPVAIPLAELLSLPLAIAVVSKITLPWNTEVGYGAVAFDSSVILNDRMIAQLALPRQVIEQGIEQTRAKVARRVTELCGSRAPDVSDKTAIVVDDGLASGFTLRAALQALRNAGARRVVVAVPTAHELGALALAREIDELYCANLRAGSSFAVADAYRSWRDVNERELAELLRSAQGSSSAARA